MKSGAVACNDVLEAVENAAPDTKMPRSLFHILHAEPLPLREGADHRLGLPLLPLLHLNPGQTSASGSSWIKGQQSGI